MCEKMMPLRSDAAAATLSMQDAVVGIPVVDGHLYSCRADQLGDQPRGQGPNDHCVACSTGVLCSTIVSCHWLELCAGKETGDARNYVEGAAGRPRQGPSSQN